MPDVEAAARFGDRTLTVTGCAGTAFFENTEAFHRRRPGGERRVMLNLLFASHRGLLSHGRTSREHRRRRDRTLQALQRAAAIETGAVAQDSNDEAGAAASRRP
jgi:hypothetical protein